MHIAKLFLLGLPAAGCAPSEDKTQDTLKKITANDAEIAFYYTVSGQTFGHRKLDNDAKN